MTVQSAEQTSAGMPLAFFLAAILAPPAASPPITVTGHAWAPFISPMGEPFRAKTATDDTLADWFTQADSNHDGFLTLAEMQADAQRFFERLDTDHNGEIDPDELATYEYDIAPDIQVMSKTKRLPGQAAAAPRPSAGDGDDPLRAGPRDRKQRRDEDYASLGMGNALQGAARYALLNIPEPVAAADTDFNRAVTLQEFEQAAAARFQLLDTMHQGKLTLAQLEAMPHAPSTDKHRKLRDVDADDTRIGNPLPPGP